MQSKLVTPVILVCNDEYWLPFALEASKGFFARYVIYDVGSTDRTSEIIEWFYKSNPKASYYIRSIPEIPKPSIQGVFRNSMIAETQSEYYFILDGDEIYTPESYKRIIETAHDMNNMPDKIYGILRRIEIAEDCKTAYGLDIIAPHHRLYHRSAIWTGKHPGEVALIPQKSENEVWVSGGAICYHFHNCERSAQDKNVPQRIERRSRGTYRPGEKKPIELLQQLPMLKTQIKDFARNPALEKLVSGQSV